VFENRFLKTIFGPKGDEITVKWRKLHSEELHTLYSSPCISRHIKSRRMGWVGQGMRHAWERREKCTRRESLKKRDHSEDQGVLRENKSVTTHIRDKNPKISSLTSYQKN
jgi:hypothetical protein